MHLFAQRYDLVTIFQKNTASINENKEDKQLFSLTNYIVTFWYMVCSYQMFIKVQILQYVLKTVTIAVHHWSHALRAGVLPIITLCEASTVPSLFAGRFCHSLYFLSSALGSMAFTNPTHLIDMFVLSVTGTLDSKKSSSKLALGYK